MRKSVEYLNSNVWATVRRSYIHGVGVIAIRDIKKGTRLTDYSVHNIKDIVMCELTEAEMEQVHPAVRELILDRTTFREGRDIFRFYSPNCEQTLTSFMNHSDAPNSDGRFALRDIMGGEEITEDFSKLAGDEAMHPLTTKHYEKFLNT